MRRLYETMSPATNGKDSERSSNMTIVQYLPHWLRPRLRKPSALNPTTAGENQRKAAPALPQRNRSPKFSEDDSPPGYRVLWRH